ncbi:MAG: 3-hydroxyacyl-ACP dehydratase FabZ [Gammaproteobacteria bacterium]|nr:3-hydroxyacyl-ACP dehydratase FabZ [Gammaproteobacteria bacterium]
MLMNVEEIKEYLPQRYPFLLVDRIVEMELGKSVVGYKNVTVNEPFFVGHFPSEPIMPGVLIIEALGQVAGVLGFKSQGKKPKDGYQYLFVGVDNARFRRPVVPGDRLMLMAEMENFRRGIYKFKCTAKVDDELVTSMNIMCAERKVSLD